MHTGRDMKVAVYCASSTKLRQEFYDDAREVGRLLGQRGVTLVNGAGNMGLMQASADACLEAGGKVVGVIPRFMVRQGWHHEGLTELIEVDDMSSRKDTINAMSDATLVLAGGCGTLDELFEIITNKQLGLYSGPIVLLNTLGFYDHVLAHLRLCMEENFMRPEHRGMWTVTLTPREAVEAIYGTPQWDPSKASLARI